MADGDVCCVLQCPLSEPSRSMRSVCFFAFPHPSDPRYPVWIERTLRPKGWTPSAASTICSRHFCSADILTVPSAEDCEKTERRLKHDALPSLFEGIPRSLQPPVGSVPRPDSPEIGASSVLKMHRPVESVPRPDSPEIAVASSKKRSADSCLSTLELPPTKAARVDKETIERCTASPKATPRMAEACVAPLASPAPMLYFPSPDILFRPQSSDQAVAAKPLPLPPQSAAVAPSSNSANELERGVKVALVSPCSSAKPASAVVDADTVQICCVPGCLITSRNASGTVLFPFLLPDHELYDTWVKQIRCTAFWQPQPPSYICSQHFHRSDWEVCRISGNIRKAPLTTLRDGVVPFRSACIAAFHFSGVRDGEAAKAQTKVCDVRTCLACGAKRNGWTKPSEILMFYPFPKDIHLRSKWINCLPDLTRHQMDTEQSLVCQNHFDAEDFELGSGCGILKASAVPKRRPRFGTRSRRKKGEGKVGKKSEVCCVPGCRIPPEELGSGRITYTRFPVDEARRDKWISCMQCAVSWAPCRGDDMVCSRHFTTRDFPQSVAKIRRLASSGLKQSAVPSQLECVEKFRTPINPTIPLDEIQCCCICGWWRSTELCKRSERLTFFPFPKLTVQWKLWIAACRELNPEFVFSFGLLVCENHFKPEDWRWQTWNTSKLILKPTAVPLH
ncbi:uncharacterized protein LOC129585467 [Paramacrobiotus metropolitanus]|uniref:uncharacterized protein LOC129585467 n=1 Tax=Paramacrobiotus metropolitanus TaxID=2943436 RepID=UPI002445812C|nr:uncharacterized protein LOC129585467 [Paramacrobiotus metropolitanus]